jgi:integrase
LSERTVENHIINLNVFLRNGLSIEDFLLDIKNTRSVSTYRDYLCTIKVLFRDYLKQPEMVADFQFPTKQCKPKILPTKKQLKTFFNSLPDRYKVIFLALASSGLRVSELLGAEIDTKNHMLIPKAHSGSTKHSWISFYNGETALLLKDSFPEITVDGLNHVFKKVSVKTGINVYPHLLRAVFAREMSLRGVPDRYIDAFCGRTPQSVLARHYSDYSPEVLKLIYDKTNLRFFG